jgi:hypothetical protein
MSQDYFYLNDASNKNRFQISLKRDNSCLIVTCNTPMSNTDFSCPYLKIVDSYYLQPF